jgi:cytochrome c oxidase assembly protein Cox11
MPIAYWVDPKISEDPNTRDIRTITINYTFFRTLAMPSAPAPWPMPGSMSAAGRS